MNKYYIYTLLTLGLLINKDASHQQNKKDALHNQTTNVNQNKKPSIENKYSTSTKVTILIVVGTLIYGLYFVLYGNKDDENKDDENKDKELFYLYENINDTYLFPVEKLGDKIYITTYRDTHAPINTDRTVFKKFIITPDQMFKDKLTAALSKEQRTEGHANPHRSNIKKLSLKSNCNLKFHELSIKGYKLIVSLSKDSLLENINGSSNLIINFFP